MSVTPKTLAAACALVYAGGLSRAAAEDAKVSAQDTAQPDDLDLRLTLSTFLFRQTGAETDPLVSSGAPIESASPVRRYFGDLRVELTSDGVELDGRVRQTTSEDYQSGAAGGDEYELRKLSYRLGGDTNALTIGRQYIEAVGATKIDGLAFSRKLTPTLTTTVFGGAFPQLGSRSVDTDYARIRNEDGTLGARLIPVSGGLGAAYSTGGYHGDIGLAAVYVAQDVPNATSQESSRVFATATGYSRPVRAVDIYHFALLDIAGANGVNLTNGSVGLNLHPANDVQVTASVNHVSSDILQIAARNTLEDPDPNAIGVVQNNIAIIRVSQDVVRGGASLALAAQRFEVSVSGGFHRRPAVNVDLADGTAVKFPETKFADATVSVLDRRSFAKLRLQATATLMVPVGNQVPNRSRGGVVRLAARRTFAEERGEIIADVMAQRFRDESDGGMCSDFANVFACYSATKTSAAQAGILGSWRIGREWLLLLDAHVGTQQVEGTLQVDMTPVVATSPTVYSVTSFARVQWRFR